MTPFITSARAASARLQALADPARALLLQRFFKTGPGEYAEGDRLRGLRVPQVRQVARQCRLDHAALTRLLASRWHEDRLLALVVMVEQFRRGDERERAALFRLYCANIARVNNWDLVDVSAPDLVGGHLWQRSRALLGRLARSPLLWERRIAILATLYFIRRGDFRDTLRLARLLRDDEHDLIHKAVGWMLREVGKRDRQLLEQYLEGHAAHMPRTMLRYAIERLPARLRRRYMTVAAC